MATEKQADYINSLRGQYATRHGHIDVTDNETLASAKAEVVAELRTLGGDYIAEATTHEWLARHMRSLGLAGTITLPTRDNVYDVWGEYIALMTNAMTADPDDLTNAEASAIIDVLTDSI